MRNLHLWNLSGITVEANPDEDVCMCFGNYIEKDGEVYVCYPNLTVKCFYGIGIEKWSKDLKGLVSSDTKAVNMTYLHTSSAISVALENGELVTISSAGKKEPELDNNICEYGIQALQWSPDQEVVAIVSKSKFLFMMSCDDLLTNICKLNTAEFGEQEFVTVKWGKKETQFHGREGKSARVEAEITPEGETDESIKISWRGDSQLFAVGFAMDGMRRFKIFDRNGHLQYTSEKQPGLDAILAWRPSGNVIATTQKVNGKYMVSFFEKNGLKHGGFDLPFDPTVTVEDLQWSYDSEVLALLIKDTDDKQQILLFTTSNYHWYLKQTLNIESETKVRQFGWDHGSTELTNNKKLFASLDDGTIMYWVWIWNVDHSTGKSDEDDAVVAVIDGNKILVTGFRQTVVPPPMAAVELQLNSNVNSVHFATKDKPNAFFAITADEKMVVFEQTQKFPLQYKETKSVSLEKYYHPLQYCHWRWCNIDTIMCIKLVGFVQRNLIEYYLDDNKISMRETRKLPYQMGGGDMEYENVEMVKFEVPFTKFEVFFVDEVQYLIGLTQEGNLYLNKSMIMTNVSSYFVHSDFLLLTTLEHELVCAELTAHGMEGFLEYARDGRQSVYKRKIERGAKLVVVVPNDTRTILQMPRGNLEAIQPRPISLKIIGKYLDALKYFEAFDLMRKQRINLNLIYDHDPEKFVGNINVFLDSIANNNSWLSLFLSDLENVDVTKTMYTTSYNENRTSQDLSNKVRKICELVRKNLSDRPDTDERMLPFLTSFVKTNTEKDLENALLLIKDLKSRESAGSKLPVGSDEALKYLLYMVDVNTLFHVALGMYDFELVLLVANKSQKDPKEFIPMLNEFNEMEENYKRFSINKHLKRFDKAVESLVNCGEKKHDELKTFVKYHSLYKVALWHFSPDQEIYKAISEDFGNYLRLQKQFQEAGIVFERGSNIEKAIECYKVALEWELALNLAQELPNAQFQELCHDLVSSLKAEKRHKDALTILEQYIEDKEEAIRYAVDAGCYKTAIRLCSQYKKPELRDFILKPAILEEYDNQLELIQINYTTFMRHKDRLKIAREAKKNHPLDVYDPTFDNAESDLYSDAGSTLGSSRGSSNSNRSFRSSKNRRKHKRKVASLKEGSQYEDVALVMALHTLVTSSFDLRSHTKEIVTALCWAGFTEAALLQASLDKLLREMKDSFRDIWTNELMEEAAKASIAAQIAHEGTSTFPQGIASLDQHMRVAPIIQEMNWKLEGLF